MQDVTSEGLCVVESFAACCCFTFYLMSHFTSVISEVKDGTATSSGVLCWFCRQCFECESYLPEIGSDLLCIVLLRPLWGISVAAVCTCFIVKLRQKVGRHSWWEPLL